MATLAQAKRDFELGALCDFQIQRASNLSTWEWVVVLRYSLKIDKESLVDARTKQERVFKSIDAAAHAVEEIGFQVDALRLGV